MSCSDALAFAPAAPAEALLAREKDGTYVAALGEQAFLAAQSLCGGPVAQAWRAELRTAAALAYFGLTTARGKPTPGEQHCDLSLVDARAALPIGAARRTALVLLHVALPYCLERVVARLVAAARRMEEAGDDAGYRARALALLAPRLAELVAAVVDLHRGWCMLRGHVLSVAQRLTEVTHVRHSRFRPPRAGYWPLGVMVLLRLGLSAAAALRRANTARLQAAANGVAAISATSASGATDDTIADAAGGARTCALCLAPRRAPSATPCGHVFCWSCVHEWLADKHECPLCRTPMLPQTVRCLQSYD